MICLHSTEIAPGTSVCAGSKKDRGRSRERSPLNANSDFSNRNIFPLFLSLCMLKECSFSRPFQHSSLGWDLAQIKYQKNYPRQTKASFELIGVKSSHRAKKIKIYRAFFRDIGPNRSKVGPNSQILSF